MSTKPEKMGVRFLRPEDMGAIKRVQKASSSDAMKVVTTEGVKRFAVLRDKARSIDTSVTYKAHKKFSTP